MQKFKWSWSVRNDETRFLKKFIEQYGINTLDSRGWTALHTCVEWKLHNCVKYLIEHKADIHIKTSDTKETLLHSASSYWDTEILKIILANNPNNINSRDIHGRTALHIAIAHRDSSAVKLLLKHGAKVNQQSRDGYTELDLVASFFNSYGHDDEHMKDLVLAGAKCNKIRNKKTSKWISGYRKRLANCKLASVSLRRVLTLTMCKLNKDLIPIIVDMVWETNEGDIWDI